MGIKEDELYHESARQRGIGEIKTWMKLEIWDEVEVR